MLQENTNLLLDFTVFVFLKIIAASGLPRTEKGKEFGIIL
jgi:hypothetical protein